MIFALCYFTHVLMQIDLLRAKEINLTDAEKAQLEGERVKKVLELAAKER